MQDGLVIFGFLFPSGQDSTKAIHPAMLPINYPTMGFELHDFTGIRLLFTGLDVRLVEATL